MTNAKTERLRFLTLFPDLRQVALFKDVGQLPYYLAEHRGWASSLAFCQPYGPPIQEAHYEQVVDMTLLGITKSRIKRLFALGGALACRSRSTDVLNLYQLGIESMLYAFLYRALNPDGVSFLKLDMDVPTARMYYDIRPSFRRSLNHWLLARTPIDFFTVETRAMEEVIRPFFQSIGQTLRFMPNGFSADQLDVAQLNAEKENLVLHVAQLGMPQKNSEQLLQTIDHLPPDLARSWKFFFVGAVTPAFKSEFNGLLSRRPDLADQLVLREHISDRQELFRLFRRARIFCMTSRWESFGLVLLEALYFGCLVISTRVGAAEDLLSKGVGRLVDVENEPEFTRVLAEELSRERDSLATVKRSHESVVRDYSWESIGEQLAGYIDLARSERQRPLGAPSARRGST